MLNAIFTVTLTTEQPMSITLPVAEGTRANRFENSPIMTRGLDAEGNPKETCYIPATTFRGMLRRNAVMPKMEARQKAGNPYKLSEAYADLIGQDSASEQQANEIDLVALKEQRKENPIVDLFGLGLGLQSRLKVSHFLPESDVLPEVFTTARKDLADSDDGRILELLHKDEMDVYLQRSTANSRKSQAQSLLDQLKRKKRKEPESKDLDTQIEKTEKKIKEYADLMDGMENSSRAIFGFYAMPQGVNWLGKMVITNFQDRDMKIICDALDRFSYYPMLGAQHARGCGEISGKMDVKVGENSVKRISFGGFEAAKIDDI